MSHGQKLTGRTYRIRSFCFPRACVTGCRKTIWLYFVSDVIDNLNLSAFDAVYGEEQRGQPPYDPRMMTKLLVYGYCVGVYS